MQKRDKCDVCGSKKLKSYKMGSHEIKSEQLNSDQFQVTNKDYGSCLEMVLCEKCDLVQTKHVFDFKIIVKLYEQVNDAEYLKSAEERGQSNYDQLKKYFPTNTNTILEVGAGSGTLIKLMKQDYPEVLGIEPSKNFCDFAKRNYGVVIKNISYEELDTTQKFDVIVALDVIEHVVSPDDFVKKIASLLKHKGVLIIGTPNRNSVTAKILSKKWWHIRPPHISYFNDKSSEYLFAKHNLKLLKKGQFYWTFPFYYLTQTLQKWVFGRIIYGFKFLKFKIILNTFDSRIYVLTRP